MPNIFIPDISRYPSRVHTNRVIGVFPAQFKDTQDKERLVFAVIV